MKELLENLLNINEDKQDIFKPHTPETFPLHDENFEFYEGFLELHDHRTLQKVKKEVDPDNYESLLDQVMSAFEGETGVSIYMRGKSGRHVLVDDTIENRENYDKLKSVAFRLEKELIDELNEDIKKALKTAVVTTALGATALGLGLHRGDISKPATVAAPTKISRHTQTSATRQPNVDINKVIHIESSGDPKAVSRTGARGLMQLMKPTWTEMVRKMGKDWRWDEAFDPEKNKAVGTYYLNTEIPRLLKHYGVDDNLENRLISYNWGIGNLQKHGKDKLPTETSDYLKKYSRLGEKIKDKQFTYTVAISKVYFPKKTQPKEVGAESMFLWKVKAPYGKRGEAAKIAWEQNKDEVLKLVRPDVRRISLHVSGERRTKFAGRMVPITVWNKIKESTIDFPQEDLDPAVWNKKANVYTIKPEVKGQIFSVLDKYEPVNLREIADTIHITGSIGTNQYTHDADIDIHIITHPMKVKDGGIVQKEVFKWFKENRDRLGAYVNDHPFEVYIQFNPKQELLAEAVYDLLEDKWVKGPKIVHVGYNPYTDFVELLDDVADAAEDADKLLGELKRDVIDYEIIRDVISRMTGVEMQRLFNNLLSKLQEIEDDINDLMKVKGRWIEMRRVSSLPATEAEALKDVELAKKWRDSNAIFKFLNRYRYMKIIGELERLMQDEEIGHEEVDVIKHVIGTR